MPAKKGKVAEEEQQVPAGANDPVKGVYFFGIFVRISSTCFLLFIRQLCVRFFGNFVRFFARADVLHFDGNFVRFLTQVCCEQTTTKTPRLQS